MRLAVPVVVFFASGFAALLYQVIWQRMLATFLGADVYSATVIVAAFMAGLGTGHLAGGHLADRLSARGSLAAFGAAELSIALFAAVSTSLYYGVLYGRLAGLDLHPAATAAVLFVSLLWPTFFMGASLPLLARALITRIDRAARIVGTLYAVNTLGAAAGAAIATWVLLPRVGLDGSLEVGAIVNLACATAVIPLAVRRKSDAPETLVDNERPGTPAIVAGRDAFWFWAVTFGFGGFVGLSYEIVWFRLLGVMVKSTAFTFGTLLTLYLTGLGLGAIIGSALAPRVRRPAVAFLLCQAGAGVSAAVLITLLVSAADARALNTYFGSYEPLSVRDSVQSLRALVISVMDGTPASAALPANFLRMYIALPVLLIVPPTILMGCAFPFLQRVVHTELHLVGRRVGGLLLANVAGSIAGTILTGWLSLTVLGTAPTLQLLASASALFALGAVAAARPGRSGWALATLGCAAVVTPLMPDAASLWARLHGTMADQILFAEDNSGLSVIRADGAGFGGTKVVFVNGVGQSVVPYGDIHTALGAVPALIHPNPRDIAIIGLGSGDTVYAAASRTETERVVCIEIIGPQLATLRALAARDGYGGLRALLSDPRIVHRAGDGRAFLMRGNQNFDIIEADALRPTSAYSGNLYSEAYFTLVRSRLKPHGLAATWVPTARVHNTFVKVFPYAISVPGILLGSNEPFDIDRAAVSARLSDPRVRAYYQRADIDIAALMQPYIDGTRGRVGPDFNRSAIVDVNTDLFPRDEFDLVTR